MQRRLMPRWQAGTAVDEDLFSVTATQGTGKHEERSGIHKDRHRASVDSVDDPTMNKRPDKLN